MLKKKLQLLMVQINEYSLARSKSKEDSLFQIFDLEYTIKSYPLRKSLEDFYHDPINRPSELHYQLNLNETSH